MSPWRIVMSTTRPARNERSQTLSHRRLSPLRRPVLRVPVGCKNPVMARECRGGVTECTSGDRVILGHVRDFQQAQRRFGPGTRSGLGHGRRIPCDSGETPRFWKCWSAVQLNWQSP